MKKKYVFSKLKFLDNFEKCENNNVFIAKIPEEIKTKNELFDVYIKELKLPWYFGKNWDAFNEVLTDLNWIEEKRVIICHQGIPVGLKTKDLRIYLEILVDSIEDWEKNPIGDFKGAKEHELVVAFPLSCIKRIEEILKNGD